MVKWAPLPIIYGMALFAISRETKSPMIRVCCSVIIGLVAVDALCGQIAELITMAVIALQPAMPAAKRKTHTMHIRSLQPIIGSKRMTLLTIQIKSGLFVRWIIGLQIILQMATFTIRILCGIFVR